MKISVIIPARNMAATLPRAIESALAANADEIVIFNDASEDDTIKVTMKYRGNRVKLLNSPLNVRAGVCFARNFAIQHAQNDLIVPLDADDTLTDKMALLALVSAFTPGHFVYGGWLEDGQRKHPPPFKRLSEKNIVHSTWLFHKKDWQHVAGYNPVFEPGCEDWAFMCSLIQGGVKPREVKEAIYHKSLIGQRQKPCYRRRDLLWSLLKEYYPTIFNTTHENDYLVQESKDDAQSSH